MAKTQYSFTTDPDRCGAITENLLSVLWARFSASAGFVIFTCGELMTMLILPWVPIFEQIMLSSDFRIEYLFKTYLAYRHL